MSRKKPRRKASPIIPPPNFDPASESPPPSDVPLEEPKFFYKRPNTKLIFGIAAGTVIVGAGMHFVHGFQVDRNAGVLLNRATAAREAGDTSEALKYLTQYVRFRPGDVDALVMLAELTEARGDDWQAMIRVYMTYEEILRREPERHEIARRFVALAVRLQRFDTALDVAASLRPNDAEGTTAEMYQQYVTDADLDFLIGQCHEGQGDERRAIVQYLKAIGLDPHRYEFYVRMASVVREQPTRSLAQHGFAEAAEAVGLADVFPAMAKAGKEGPEVADRILQRMVDTARPKQDALLARAVYRQLHKDLGGAAEDVTAARQIAPDDLDVLLTAAEVALARVAQAREQRQKALVEEQLQLARQMVEQGLTLQPPDPRFHLIAARLALDDGSYELAMKRLHEGLEVLDAAVQAGGSKSLPRDLRAQFLWTLADVHLTQFERVADSEAESGDQGASQIPSKPVTDVIVQLKAAGARPVLVEFLEARLLYVTRERGFAESDTSWNSIIRALEDVRVDLRRYPDLMKRVDLMLAICHRNLGNPDQEVDVFRRALNDDQLWTEGRWRYAKALVAVNRIDEALREYALLPPIPGVPLEIARLLFIQQLPLKNRSWETVSRALDAEEQLSPESPQPLILRAEIRALEGQIVEAIGLLEQGLDRFADEPSVWTALALIELRRTDVEPAARLRRAEELLREARGQLGDIVELRLAAATAATLLPREQARLSIKELETTADEFSPDDRVRLLDGLARSYARIGAADEAWELWQEVLRLRPRDLSTYLLLAQLARERQDEAAFAALLREIRAHEGEAGPNGDFYEAVDLLGRVMRDEALVRVVSGEVVVQDREGLSQALERPRILLVRAARGRPHWSAIPAALGDLEYVQGNLDAAAMHYEEALARGNRSPELVQRIVRHYLQQKRYDEADRLLSEVTDDTPSLLSGDLARLASQVALAQQQYDKALGLADDAAADSEDFRDHVWRGLILFSTYQSLPADQKHGDEGRRLLGDAEVHYRQAVELASDQPAAWFAFVVHLSRAGEVEKAKEVIEEAKKQLPKEPLYLAPLTLARCYEAIGSRDLAEAAYLQALEAGSNDWDLRILVARFYLQTGEFGKAGEHLEVILDPQSGAPQTTVAWATRIQAVILGTSGGYQEMQQALRAIERLADSSEAVVVEDLRAQLLVLGRWNTRQSRQQQVVVLEQIDDEHQLTPAEQLRLASLYEAAGEWPKAEEMLTRLYSSDPANAFCVAQMAQGLISQSKLDLAEEWIRKLDELMPSSLVVVVLRCRLLAAQGQPDSSVALVRQHLAEHPDVSSSPDLLRDLVVQNKAAEAIEALQAYLQDHPDPAASSAIEEARRLLDEGNAEAAINVLRDHLVQSGVQRSLQMVRYRTLARLLDEFGELPAAEQVIREYLRISQVPEDAMMLISNLARQRRVTEALELCEQAWSTCPPETVAGTSVALARGTKLTGEPLASIARRLEAAVQAHPESTALAIYLADLRDYQERYAEAEALYRTILARAPRHAVALNNLAWLLAAQKKGGTEALEHINRAISMAGPIPELLDTRAAVHLSMANPEAAVEDLSDALADGESAVRLFHLAEAHLRNRDLDLAAEAYQQAVAAGLTEQTLHPLEREVYRVLAKRFAENSLSQLPGRP